ncbi:KDO2-lipid IV(A) lauroyltransferase [Lacinutrix venerupis]|uniref:Lipid A biosynthesis acyltransferase n=1 Tax=Lacinutrix venerupis TaxID=1486034 RepID=A0AAC9LNA1_9FLAO|nr:lysophospholipid acyltransferase family protein [Lacinutrix venerupis]APY00560.1 lipid A biosynthesis acyltransferase [Lacinutrix venerupis]RLJ60780.1 KDO2-lipid IV(A) lauroyltransferase [Lacinutrix venerupis]
MQLLAYILIYPFLWLISILPFKLLYAFSDFVFIIVYRIFKYRKKVVKQNLRLVFPEKSKDEIEEITRKFYHHLCDMIFESIKSMTISEKEMRKRFTFTDLDILQNFEKKNRSLILMCAHYASWEWIFILQKHVNYTGFGIYKRLSNKYFDALVKRIRARYNSYLITTKETVSTLSASKAKGELSMSGFASDQSPKIDKAHHWQNFMGIKVPVHTGAEMIAKKLDMSVVFFGTKRLKRGYYQTGFKILAENPNDYKNYEITDAFLKIVEQQILEAPEFYLWTHKRWKHRDKVPKEFL